MRTINEPLNVRIYEIPEGDELNWKKLVKCSLRLQDFAKPRRMDLFHMSGEEYGTPYTETLKVKRRTKTKPRPRCA